MAVNWESNAFHMPVSSVVPSSARNSGLQQSPPSTPSERTTRTPGTASRSSAGTALKYSVRITGEPGWDRPRGAGVVPEQPDRPREAAQGRHRRHQLAERARRRACDRRRAERSPARANTREPRQYDDSGVGLERPAGLFDDIQIDDVRDVDRLHAADMIQAERGVVRQVVGPLRGKARPFAQYEPRPSYESRLRYPIDERQQVNVQRRIFASALRVKNTRHHRQLHANRRSRL